MPEPPVFEAHVDSAGLVVVRGEIDIMTADELRRVLDSALETGGLGPGALGRGNGRGAVDLVVDLAGVSFLDASGAGVLAEVARRAAASGRRLTVCNQSGMVRRVLEILGPTLPFQTDPGRAPEVADPR